MGLARCVSARVELSFSVTHPSPISRIPAERGSRNPYYNRGQLPERIFRCEKHHTAMFHIATVSISLTKRSRVIARLDRATQYSRAVVIEPTSRGVLDTRMRGYDGS